MCVFLTALQISLNILRVSVNNQYCCNWYYTAIWSISQGLHYITSRSKYTLTYTLQRVINCMPAQISLRIRGVVMDNMPADDIIVSRLQKTLENAYTPGYVFNYNYSNVNSITTPRVFLISNKFQVEKRTRRTLDFAKEAPTSHYDMHAVYAQPPY